MTIKARVHNCTIVLPASVEIAKGTEVQIIVPEKPLVTEGALTKNPEWIQKARGSATSGLSTDEIMRLTRGEA